MLKQRKVTPKNWIIVGPKNQNSKDSLVGYFDYYVGQDKSNPGIYFRWTLANLIALVYTTPRVHGTVGGRPHIAIFASQSVA